MYANLFVFVFFYFGFDSTVYAFFSSPSLLALLPASVHVIYFQHFIFRRVYHCTFFWLVQRRKVIHFIEICLYRVIEASNVSQSFAVNDSKDYQSMAGRWSEMHNEIYAFVNFADEMEATLARQVI